MKQRVIKECKNKDKLNEYHAKKSDDDLRQLPPSRGALLLHTKGAYFQAGYIRQECQEDLLL